MNANDYAAITNIDSLNKSQYSALDYFLSIALNNRHYEIKGGNVHELYRGKGGTTQSVVVDLGIPNDEGTWAEVICRMHFHLFIGPRGKITARSAPKHREQFKGKTALGAYYPDDCGFFN